MKEEKLVEVARAQEIPAIANISERYHANEIVVIGGGPAGLTTAAILARAGRSVTLVDQSSQVGGRARTAVYDDFYFNQGPHALYQAGAEVLRELGVVYTGSIISAAGILKAGTITAFGIKQGKLYQFQSLEFGPMFDLLGKIDFSEIENMTVTEWLNKNVGNSDVADIVKAFLRTNTYANDPDIQSAGSALGQLARNISKGVMYIDGGWQTLVDGLSAAAMSAKAKIVTGKKAIKIERRQQNSGWLVNLSDESQLSANIVVMATGPREAYALFNDVDRPEVLSRAAKESRPVRMACLDIALSTLPDKSKLGAIGIDTPVYFSVHSAYAKLALENGGALIHVAKYLGTSIEPKPTEDQRELESLLDLLQPGWREVLVKKRPLPNMVVTNALDTAVNGGLSGRPDTKILDDLYVVGDWVGPEGLLSDASFASAKRAAKLIIDSARIC